MLLAHLHFCVRVLGIWIVHFFSQKVVCGVIFSRDVRCAAEFLWFVNGDCGFVDWWWNWSGNKGSNKSGRVCDFHVHARCGCGRSYQTWNICTTNLVGVGGAFGLNKLLKRHKDINFEMCSLAPLPLIHMHKFQAGTHANQEMLKAKAEQGRCHRTMHPALS